MKIHRIGSLIVRLVSLLYLVMLFGVALARPGSAYAHCQGQGQGSGNSGQGSPSPSGGSSSSGGGSQQNGGK
jgi:uncharacterized membrane protein YgcG